MKYLLTLLACCCVIAGFAQEKSTKDTVLIIAVDSAKAGQKKVTVKVQKERKDTVKVVKPSSKFYVKLTFSRIDLGLSKNIDNGSFTLSPENAFLESETWKSSNFGFDLFEMAYRFNSYFKVYLAAGFDWHHMRLKQNITISKPGKSSIA